MNLNRNILNCSDEIAGCIEKAYEQIQFNEATRVLFFSSPKKMTDYAKKVCGFSFGQENKMIVASYCQFAGIKIRNMRSSDDVVGKEPFI